MAIYTVNRFSGVSHKNMHVNIVIFNGIIFLLKTWSRLKGIKMM